MINATWFGIGPCWKVSNIKSFIYNSTEERRRYTIWATVIKSAIIKAERPGFMLGFQDFHFTPGTYLFWAFHIAFGQKYFDYSCKPREVDRFTFCICISIVCRTQAWSQHMHYQGHAISKLSEGFVYTEIPETIQV